MDPCLLGYQAGLFSAVAGAFIIEVDSQLQPDPNDETHALLRILIYKIDNSSFGNNVPTVPQWTGPPRAIVDVQAILFASLTVSLFSAFLAMLGKQWLSRYDSADMRGTMVERSQNRQRKLDGIAAWYFDNVLESLPLMLQAALLLFGCALSRYLWEVNRTIASVVLGVTSFGALSYLFIIVAGTVFENCPYQTPGAHILRHHLLPPLRSIFSKFPGFIKASGCYRVSIKWWENLGLPWYSRSNIIQSLITILLLLIAPVTDVYHLGQAIIRSLVAFSRTLYHRFMDTSLRRPDVNQRSIMLDLRCVSWMLLTSLDKAFHVSALKYLATMPELACFDPFLVTSCFNIFISCINVIDDTPVMVQGLEQLAAPSAFFFLRAFRHLLQTDPTSNTLATLRRRYNRVFLSSWVDFTDLPIRYTMIAAHMLVNPHCKPPAHWKWRNDNRPSAQEHNQLAWCMVKAAQAGHQRKLWRRVPGWTLHFAFDSLSLDPPPPPSVVADCLKIIAIDLGCDLSNITTPDERCVQFYK
jgi:hypothetical protein